MIADGPLTVYGDSAYGTGALLESFEQSGIDTRVKTQPPRAPGGRFPKSEFGIDLDAGHGHLSGRSHRRDTTGQGRADRPVRRAVRRLPARRQVHQLDARDARSISASTSATSPRPAPAKPIRSGRPTTPRPGRPWSARSRTSCAESTADGAPACAAHPRSPPTSNYSPPPSTSPDSACSDSPDNPADGRSAPAERPTRARQTPANPSQWPTQVTPTIPTHHNPRKRPPIARPTPPLPRRRPTPQPLARPVRHQSSRATGWPLPGCSRRSRRGGSESARAAPAQGGAGRRSRWKPMCG